MLNVIYAECHLCQVSFMLSVIMLNVVAPLRSLLWLMCPITAGDVFTTFHFITNGSNKLLLHYTRQENLTKDKHSILLGPFVSSEENKVL
jgi:hypothetical protein